MMQLSIFDLPPTPEPVIAPMIAPDLLAELTAAHITPADQAVMTKVEIPCPPCGVCFDCPGTLTGQSWQCAVNPDHRALVDLAALGRDLPANWIRGAQVTSEFEELERDTQQETPQPDCLWCEDAGCETCPEPDTQDRPDLLPVAVGIEGSACNFCGAPMIKHHPDLPVWRCTADEWHRFWLSKLGEGRKAKRIGVWLGHSRADPGSGPGEIPEWAEK